MPTHSGVHLLIASNNDEKEVGYKGIGHLLRRFYGGPVHVTALSWFDPHCSPPEDGHTSCHNAIKKLHEARPAMDRLRPGNDKRRSLQRLQRRLGIDHASEHAADHNTVVFTEDAVLGVPADIASGLAKILKPQVNEGLLDRVEHVHHAGRDYVVFAEFGPMKDAVGSQVFFDAIRRAALEAGYKNKPVPLLDKVSCGVMRLSDPPGSPDHPLITATTVTYLHAPQGLDKPYPELKIGMNHSSRFTTSATAPKTPISDRLDDYLMNESFRRVVLDKLVAWTIGTEGALILPFRRSGSDIVRRPKAPRILQLTTGDVGSASTNNSRLVGRHTISNHTPITADQLISAFGMEFSFGRTRSNHDIVATAGGIVIPPQTLTTQKERVEHAAMVSSAIVAIQTDPRYKHAFIALMNLDKCHDETVKMLATFANTGMSADYPRSAVYDRRFPTQKIVDVKGVELSSTRYVDVLSGTDERNMNLALRQLLDYRSNRYERSMHQPAADFFGETNIAKPDGMFAISALMSANNEKRRLSETVAAYGKSLAQIGAGAAWGGMNKNPGDQFQKAYLKSGGEWLFASSTHDIAKKETKSGQLPDGCHAWILRQNIGDRFMDLYRVAELGVVFGGGVGTLQEKAGWLALGKPLVCHDEDLHNVTSKPHRVSAMGYQIRYLLGAEKAEALVRDHNALAKEGIFLTTSQGELHERTRNQQMLHEHALKEQRVVASRPDEARTAANRRRFAIG